MTQDLWNVLFLEHLVLAHIALSIYAYVSGHFLIHKSFCQPLLIRPTITRSHLFHLDFQFNSFNVKWINNCHFPLYYSCSYLLFILKACAMSYKYSCKQIFICHFPFWRCYVTLKALWNYCLHRKISMWCYLTLNT